MRAFALTSVALAMMVILSASPAPAQTYAPDYPVCLHVYGPVSYNECYYSSIEQCRPSAIGRPAQCVENPFYVRRPAPSTRQRRHAP
jgi:hypothetical protein